jgi:hypothetical protein
MFIGHGFFLDNGGRRRRHCLRGLGCMSLPKAGVDKSQKCGPEISNGPGSSAMNYNSEKYIRGCALNGTPPTWIAVGVEAT